jgi:hypothetical protein
MGRGHDDLLRDVEITHYDLSAAPTGKRRSSAPPGGYAARTVGRSAGDKRNPHARAAVSHDRAAELHRRAAQLHEEAANMQELHASEPGSDERVARAQLLADHEREAAAREHDAADRERDRADRARRLAGDASVPA